MFILTNNGKSMDNLWLRMVNLWLIVHLWLIMDTTGIYGSYMMVYLWLDYGNLWLIMDKCE
jgi:hypothetical protein